MLMRGLGRGVQCCALEFRLIFHYNGLGRIQSGMQLLHPCQRAGTEHLATSLSSEMDYLLDATGIVLE